MYNSKTLRFDVKIDSKNSENYEISLLDLIKMDTPLLKCGENSEEINKRDNLIKEFQAKYGPVAVVKGKRIRVNDFVDQGNGYDVDDPFIDDSGEDEALVVAPDLMTEHGGFFINKESLKLNEGNFVIERVEGGNDLIVFPKPSFSHKKMNKKSKSQKLLSQARKRLTISSKSNSSMRRIVTSDNKKLEDIINNVVAITNIPDADKMEIVPKTIKKALINDAQVPNFAQEKEINVAQVNIVATGTPTQILELPIGLPGGALAKIESLKEISENCKTEGKKIEPHFDSILLELDTMLHNNQKGMKTLRTQALRYVGQITNIKYNSILRRLLKIKESKKKITMKPLFTALEDAIKEGMVESVAKYEHAMTQYLIKTEALKLSIQAAVTDDSSMNSSMDQSSDRDVDSKIKSSNKIQTPKRYFKWTFACKSLLFKLVCEELEAFRISNNKGTPEEYLHKFYQTSVINLFQPKWMTVSQLLKISFPLLTEFKQCISNGKEFQSCLPIIKQKPEQKSNNYQNGISAPPLKEAVLSIAKYNSSVDLNEYKDKLMPLQMKKPAIQLKSPSEMHIKTEYVRPQAIVNSLNKIAKPNTSPVHMKFKQSIRSSSIMYPSQPHKPISTLEVKPQETVKRYASGSLVLSPNSMLSNRVLDDHGFNLIGLPSNNSNIEPKNNRRISISNTSSVNNLAPHCSQQQQQQQQHQQQHQQQPLHHHHQQQQQQHHPLGHEYVHSTPYSIVSENISRVPNMTQKIPDLSTIFTSPIEIRQSRQSALNINNQHIVSNHNNVQQVRQIQKQYLGILSDYETQAQAAYHPNSHTHTLNNAPMIDLTGDSPTIGVHNTQLSPTSRFINMNTAHSSNPRNLQN